jgi:hypothetical protein
MLDQPYRLAAVGPRHTTLGAPLITWIENEMGRVLTRQRLRHPSLLALASLAPGVGLLWARAAISLGVPVEVWVPHPGMLDPWPLDRVGQVNWAIERAHGLVVPFYREATFEPWMYGAHLAAMAQAAHASVAVWNGDTSEYYYSITHPPTRRAPLQWLDYTQRASSWHPAGRPT